MGQMAEELGETIDKLLSFNDIVARHEIEIAIHKDGLVIWLNVDGICRARIMANGMIPIKIEDDRIGYP